MSMIGDGGASAGGGSSGFGMASFALQGLGMGYSFGAAQNSAYLAEKQAENQSAWRGWQQAVKARTNAIQLHQKKRADLIAMSKLRVGGTGIRMDTGTPVDIQRDDQKQREWEQKVTEVFGAIDAQSAQGQIGSVLAQGQVNAYASRTQGYSLLLGGASQTAMNMYQFNRAVS